MSKLIAEYSRLFSFLLSGSSKLRDVLKFLRPQPSPFNLVRLGGDSDGAYLVPDDLVGLSYCISPGVDTCKRFEDDLLEIYGIPSVLCDPTTDDSRLSAPLVKGKQILVKKWLTSRNSDEEITLGSLVLNYCSPGHLDKLLQIDIEGGEYEGLGTVDLQTLLSFRIIIIELHNLDMLIRPWDKSYEKMMKFFALISAHFVCVHAHGNNCCGDISVPGVALNLPRVLEISLIRIDRFESAAKIRTVNPLVKNHPLDVTNVRSNEQIVLNDVWYMSDKQFVSRWTSGAFALLFAVVKEYGKLQVNRVTKMLKDR